MDFHVSLEGGGDLTAQLYRRLRDAVLDGRLVPGDRLPATRRLAESLGVSRTTVATAYDRLTAEGFLTGRVGSGTYVALGVPGAGVPSRGLSKPTRRPDSGTSAGAPQPRPAWTQRPAPTSSESEPADYDFRVGVPDARLFPFDTWRRLVAQELRLTANHPGAYGEPAGHPRLRRAIARYVGYARSVTTDADGVVVTSGAQQALDVVGRVLLSPGDVVAVEEPGYPPARALFASMGARVVGVPVDGEGLVVERLPAPARLVYCTPSHQFPLGPVMSMPRRTALIAWAEQHRAAVVEDDYDSEFRFADRPLDPLHTIDGSGRVLYVGTFSKTMLPALRIGFVVSPPALQPALAAAKQLSDGFSGPSTQAALATFMDDGQLARHIRRASRVYAARRQEVLEVLSGDLADLLDVVPSAAGLHVCARLRSGGLGTVDAVISAAAAQGVAVESLAAYSHDAPAQQGFVIGYGATRSEAVAEGLARFGAALRRESGRRTARS